MGIQRPGTRYIVFGYYIAKCWFTHSSSHNLITYLVVLTLMTTAVCCCCTPFSSS